jgi:putative ABC transport system ATP-binding protein
MSSSTASARTPPVGTSRATPTAPGAAPQRPDYVVVARNVWKVYGSGETAVTALRGVSLAIPRGQMVAIMGHSGCGKTTLLNCFSGLDDLTRGRVFLEGVDIHRMADRPRSEYRARRTGFVFQNYNLLPVLTAVENVEMPLLVAGVAPKIARARASGVLGELGLADRLHHLPAELSGGQQQRVALARALVARPAIVWADEPTGNLDAEGSAQVTRLLRQLNRSYRQTMVVVTHDAEVAALCDRTYRMRDGQFVA